MDYMYYTHLPTMEWWKAELTKPQQTVYPESGQLPTTDRAHGRESPPAKTRRPKHWATPSTIGEYIEQNCL